ncbi:MAG: phosphotransferase enzyme family protein, partial [Planctomycetota bacterium]
EVVFVNPLEVIDNERGVTDHVAAALRAQGVQDVSRRVLMQIPTHDGALFHCDRAGHFWRLYRFVERTRVYQTVETPEQAYQVGRSFGMFQLLLADLAGPRLHETIADFHNTPLRFTKLERAAGRDACGRAAAAAAEIEFAHRRRTSASQLIDLRSAGEIPERVVHNDAKISNVLLDNSSGQGICLVDLDTVMPGLALYDFGDMVRSVTTTAAEDERDLSRVDVQMPLFEALARGYLEATGAMLVPAEREHLVTAGRLITLEQGVRFLTDFLEGDAYYKADRPQHNLDRCRTQFKLVESIERQQAQMRRVIERL